ncbi:sodium-coupled monocarboxylate transporter 1-like [Anneissia japonica]|uniref:sodium-coupled monocarboxylate transporter 1-like n=1 Tax=Anneissia japonica TaxID=1529436 RepID=UPI001425AEF9|nr:sodium-coupled monocarboxylate transporter 1-like [Anneissia japonica]
MTKHTNEFSAWDYVVFSLMLCVSAGIGVYHALCGGRQSTSNEYLMADRQMSAFPVGLSLLASFMSAITVLGTPAEIYNYGTMFWWFGLTYLFVCLGAAHLFLPIFYKLQLTSAYEYLEKRFNRAVRLCGTFTFFAQMLLYLGIVIYAPALALNQVTGFTLWGAVWACGIVCTFYCTVGGLKAVIWTDVFQVSVMIAGFIAVIIKGSIDMGGFSNVWDIANKGGRIEFVDFRVDPRVRHSFWSICIGGFFTWIAIYGVNQSQVQRYLSCKTMKDAQIALYFNILGLFIIVSLASMCGLVMYAIYEDCDPYTAGYVSQTDQLMPYLVMDILAAFPGIPGLFVAAMFSGALSTVSSGLNSLAAVLGEDVIKPVFKPTEERYTKISKVVVCSFGLVCIGMAYVASQLGDVLQAALSIFGMIGGPLLGLFMLGMFFPWTNSIGAVCGLFSGLGFSFWVGIGAQFYPPEAQWLNKKDLSTELCNDSFTTLSPFATTMMPTTEEPYSNLAETWYAMSYLWYSGVAVLSTVFFGLLASFISGARDPSELDPELITPLSDILFCCFPSRCRKALRCGVLYDDTTENATSLDYVDTNGSKKTMESQHYQNGTYETAMVVKSFPDSNQAQKTDNNGFDNVGFD